jgi:DNA repair protein RadC
VAEPSQADLRITQRLKDALVLLDVRVLDHLIVGDGATTSLAERGVM